MGLQGKSTGADFAARHALGRRPIGGFREVDRLLTVNPNLDVLSFDANTVVEPLVIRGRGDVHDVFHRIEPAGFLFVGVRGVHLALVASGGPTRVLVGRVEVDARVRALVGFYFGGEFEILERGFAVSPNEIEVPLAPANLEDAVGDLVGAFGGVLRRLPAREGLAIKEGDGLSGEAGGGTQEKDASRSGEGPKGYMGGHDTFSKASPQPFGSL